MIRVIAILFLTGSLLSGCAGVYVAGDAGAHRDGDHIVGESTTLDPAGARSPTLPPNN